MVTRCTLFPVGCFWGADPHPSFTGWPDGTAAGGTGRPRRLAPGVLPEEGRSPWTPSGQLFSCERLVGEERGVHSARPSAPILEGAPPPRRQASAFRCPAPSPMPSRGGRVSVSPHFSPGFVVRVASFPLATGWHKNGCRRVRTLWRCPVRCISPRARPHTQPSAGVSEWNRRGRTAWRLTHEARGSHCRRNVVRDAG
jgi:hypothetical protein